VHPFPPDPDSSQSTISTVEREIREAGGDAHALAVDVRMLRVCKAGDDTVKVSEFLKQLHRHGTSYPLVKPS